MNKFRFELPIDTVSEANRREHWTRKAARARSQRHDACYLCKINAGLSNIALNAKLIIKMIRLAPHKMDDDNLRSALKAVRDGIADWLKIDDGDERIKWEYEQQKISKTKSIFLEINLINE